MIEIIAENHVKQGMRDKFIELAAELVKRSQAEAGCIKYDLYEDISDPNTLTVIEVWKDMAAVEFHNNTPHFTSIVPKLGELIEGNNVRLYRKL